MVAAIIAVAVIKVEKKPGQKALQSYERTIRSQSGERAKYYNRK